MLELAMSSVPPVYDQIGRGYAGYRVPDPRIARAIRAALGSARSVVNVGAGAGSYEPRDVQVLAVEPSGEMIRQRPEGAARVLRGTAEQLPLADASFDAALAILTVHHWADRAAGLRELLRVAKQRVVLLTHDPEHSHFWLVADYFPEIRERDRSSMPSLAELASVLGSFEAQPVCIPHDCTDGFLGAYWRRPLMYMEDGARAAISAFAQVGDVRPGLERLKADVESGRWAARNANLLGLSELDLGYRLIICQLDQRR
jgi:SAM-dependent methyltransferase